MTIRDDSSSCYNSSGQLDKNISRLVKLTDDSNTPGRAFTESLMKNALGELGRLEVKNENGKNIIIKSNWLEKTMGWAAMVAVACGALLAIVVSTILKMSFLLEVIIVLTMFLHWLTYLGERIL